MAKQITQYELLISCPGDIIDEVKIIEDVVEKFNQQFSATLGISILTRHWSKSSYPQSGSKPQHIINQQIVEECDAAIAMFWTRFGTPTDQYGSGSEEEIEIMLEKGKQIFMYFCDKQVEPSKIDSKQYNKILKFREKYKTKGLFYCYNTNEEFKELINAHLTMHFLTLSKVKSLAEQHPCLLLKSVKDGEIIDYAMVEKFDFGGLKRKEDQVEEIKDLLNDITRIKISSNLNNNAVSNPLSKEVEISEATKNYITHAADALKIKLDSQFFDLGDLCENGFAIPTLLGGGRELIGNPNAKEKYYKILELEKLIRNMISWFSVEKCYGNNIGVKFLLANDGNTFDEDIDIELAIDKEIFLAHYSFEVLEEGTLAGLKDYYSLSDIFTIKATEKYIDYESSCKPLTHINPSSQPVGINFLNNTDYEEEYFDELDSIFDYDIYEVNDKILLKVHFDYIKQHSVIAFPTPIFLRNLVENKFISYKITSKHYPDIVNGEIELRVRA